MNDTFDPETEAIRVINVYNDPKYNLDFTLYVAKLENTNPKLYNSIINELKSGKYNVKYLNSTGQ